MHVITGGSSGIGRALALELASRGKSVVIIGRRLELLQEVAERSSFIDYVCADITSDAGLFAIEEALRDCQSIQALIHNAGIIEPIAPTTRITKAAWQNILATNLSAPLFLTQRLYSKLQHGRVLHMGSGAAHFPVKSWTGYCVSKAALAMLTRCWQLESESVAFASVMPGIIDTDMQGVIRESSSMDSNKHEFFLTLKKNKQLLMPETVALFLSWLLSLPADQFVAREWDIYDTTHHRYWLKEGHDVPRWEDAE